MKKKGKVNREGWVTSRGERTSYYLGLGGSRLIQSITSNNLATYMMFIGIDINLIAGIMLVVRILDAVDDMLFGWLIDKIHFKGDNWFTRGRFLPWIRLGAVTLPISSILLYHIPSGWNVAGKLVWFVITYILWDLSFTVSDVPNTAIAMTMTENYNERNSIMNLRYAVPLIVSLPVSWLNTILISEQVGMPLHQSVTIIVIIYTVMMIPELFLVKERNLGVKVEEEEKEGYSLREMLQFLVHCKELWPIILHKLFINSSVSSMGIFVAFYLWGSVLYSMVFGLAAIPAFVVYFILIAALVKKFEKKSIATFSMVLMTVSYFLAFIIGYGEGKMAIQIVLAFLTTLCAIPSAFMTPMLLTDVTECVKYRDGMDASGIIFSLNTFTEKLAQAIASALPLFILGLFGWQQIEAESFADLAVAGVTQTSLALKGLWIVTNLIPAIGGLFSTIAISRYKLTKQEAEIMTACNNGHITRDEAEAELSSLKTRKKA